MGDLSQMSPRGRVSVKVILPLSLYFIFSRSHAPEATNATFHRRRPTQTFHNPRDFP
jgi:hypothetical protein